MIRFGHRLGSRSWVSGGLLSVAAYVLFVLPFLLAAMAVYYLLWGCWLLAAMVIRALAARLKKAPPATWPYYK